MLYVFQVDTGSMITFDMNLALSSVTSLQEAIWHNIRIPLDRQVLLVSGGECLDPAARVCNYSAGTDTNPIFLFNKSNIESSPTSSGQHVPSSGSLENLTDIDSIKDQIKGCMDLPATYMTVVTRSQLAQQLMEMAKELLRRCEQLIHDQHLQHQGWMAVVANLEDIVNAFRQKAENFETLFFEYLRTKEERLQILASFEKDIQALKKIPILPSLLSEDDMSEISSSGKEVSILDWILSHDHHKLETICAQCYKGFEKLDMAIIEALQLEKKNATDKADNPSMKEIKGLEDRFFQLDQLLSEAKDEERNQSMQAQTFLSNQNSAKNLSDVSILPDLCRSHQVQLTTMFKKHQHLDDIRRKCAKAKQELIGNLITRLKWIMHVQHSLTEVRNKYDLYTESLRRLRSQVEILQQIHVSASIYGDAVIEVVRRKKFNEAYVKWVKSIASAMEKIHSEEIQKRYEFSHRFEGHFLSALFSGFEDFKPSITVRIVPFDGGLPEIKDEEVEKLREVFPALPADEEVPEFTIDITSASRASEESIRGILELENVNLKLELEKAKFDSQTKEDEIKRLNSLHQEEMTELNNTLQTQVQGLSTRLEDQAAKATNFQLELARVEEELAETAKKRQIDVASLSDRLNEMKQTHEDKVKELTDQWDLERNRLKEELLRQKEVELKGVEDKYRSDLEGLRSRFKLMASFDQRSPSDMQNKSFDSFERPARNDDIVCDLLKIVELANHQTDKTVYNMLHSAIAKIESSSAAGANPQSPGRGDKSPMTLRARASNLEEGSRMSIELDDEGNMNTAKSVYRLDTSAIDATAMCNSDESDSLSTDLTDTFTPPPHIVYVAKYLLKGDQITVNSGNVGDHVLVYYNARFQSHLVYSLQKHVVFLHTDCLKSLDHSPEKPVRAFTAQVAEREFCVARKPKNRYHVPQGFHFHRVKVKVLQIIDLNSSDYK